MEKNTRLFVRCTTEEKASWQRIAEARGGSLSSLVRAYLGRLAKRVAK